MPNLTLLFSTRFSLLYFRLWLARFGAQNGTNNMELDMATRFLWVSRLNYISEFHKQYYKFIDIHNKLLLLFVKFTTKYGTFSCIKFKYGWLGYLEKSYLGPIWLTFGPNLIALLNFDVIDLLFHWSYKLVLVLLLLISTFEQRDKYWERTLIG